MKTYKMIVKQVQTITQHTNAYQFIYTAYKCLSVLSLVPIY